jgi:hypothetical protein
MEKINIPFFYELGTQLNPLVKMTVTPKSQNRYEILMLAHSVRDKVNSLFPWGERLNVCRTSGIALTDAIDDAIKYWNGLKPEECSKDDSPIDEKLQQLINKARTFEVVLSRSCQ